jgi:hypothetical protein
MLMMKFGIVQHFISRSSKISPWPMHMLEKVPLIPPSLRIFLTSNPESVFSLAALESKLVAYVKDAAATAQPFDASSVPKISRAQAAQDAARKFPFILTSSVINLAPSRSQHPGYNWRSCFKEDIRRTTATISCRKTIRLCSTAHRSS